MKKIFNLIFVFLNFQLAFAQITPAWTKSIAGTGDNSDRYNAIAKDASGSIYMAGYTFNNGTDKDFLLVKMNSSGTILWNRQFNGPGNGSDKGLFVNLDFAGNVYISGESSGGSATNNDILIIKYSSAGNLLWSALYNSPDFNQDDSPLGVAVDSAGSVYITGSSDRDSSALGVNDDMLTLKYSNAGVLSWFARYNGSGNATDRGNAIVCDNNGNCIVTGRTNNGNNDDAITIKYNSAGTPVWTSIFDRLIGGNDRGEAVTLDVAGNSYIAARSNNNNDYDFATIKYNSFGVQQFVIYLDDNQNDFPEYITLDVFGNIIVAGQSDVQNGSGNNYDYQVVKYTNSGLFRWKRTFGNPLNNDEDPHALTTDALGSVYVTGKSDGDALANFVYNDYLTVKYDSAGTLQWSQYFNGTGANSDDIAEGFVLDGSNVYVVGGSQNITTQKDATVIKYAASTGVATWTQTFNGVGDFTDKVQAMITDSANNIYVTGYVHLPEHRRDLFTAKYNAAGTQLWFKTYDFIQDDDDGKSIALDSAGNIFVCGSSISNATSDDFIVIKYNTNGDVIWTARYDNVGEADVATSIAVNKSGVVYVTGYSDYNPYASISDYDITTLKINAAGAISLVTHYGNLNVADRGTKILLSGTTIFVTGRLSNGANEDIVTIKYNNSLVQQWATVYAGANAGDDQPRDIVLDGSNIIVAGQTYNGSLGDDYVILKYNGTGVMQWVTLYNGTGNYTDRAYSVAVNSSGIYITGRSAPSAGIDSADFLTMKLNKSSGAILWSDRYNYNNLFDRANEIIVNPAGLIYVTGESVSATSGSDFATIMYDANGNRKWVARYDGGLNGEDVSRVMNIDSAGFLYVAGYTSFNTPNQLDGAILKYCPPPSANAGNDITICSGSSSALNASGGVSYSWSPVSGLSSGIIANPVASPSATTTYTVTVFNSAGCSASDAVVVTVNPLPLATITPAGMSIICAGDSINLTANSGTGYSYQWKKSTTNIGGAINQSYYAKSTATYKVVVKNSFGCTKLSAGKSVVTSPTASITAAGPITFCAGDSVKLNAPAGTGYLYQWRKNNVNVSGANAVSYVAKTAGSYKCLVTDANACTAVSNAIAVTITCRESLEGSQSFSATLSPNPFTDVTELQLKSVGDELFSFTLFDILGKEIYSISNLKPQDPIEFGSELVSGVYIISITQGNQKIMSRFIKQ